MTEAEGQSQGRKLLTAVERIIADTNSLIALSQQHLSRAQARDLDGEDATLHAAAEGVVRHFSQRTAITGGLAAAPSLLPGMGSLVSLVGGTLADMGMVLKFEVEMALVLSHLHGFDITRPEERQLAFLMASVGTYDTKSGGNFFVDIARAQGQAIWNYTPREVSKLLLSVMTQIALLKLSRGLLARALPVVGIAVNSTVNHTLTRRVGARCIRDLQIRRQLVKPEGAAPSKDTAAARSTKARARPASKAKAAPRARKSQRR
ncbi:MAG: hypothetical protein JXB05_26000 [Myxococcaceae bacterium]|nr:hypothetical protein [Myxococcaceae bacterium]